MSIFPSPLKSVAAIPLAPVWPVGSGELASGTQPLPERRSTAMVLLALFATARSSAPSPLKSAAATP